MAYATDVKFFRYTDGGAPTLNGAAGSLLSVLDACLRTGYNIEAPTSITRDGLTVTITYGSAHGYLVHSVITVSGADQSPYNGDFRVVSVATNSLTVELPAGSAPTTPATGTFETRQTPAGWTREFVGTNVAVYKSSDAAATGCRLRVDDTNSATRRGSMRGYISMTDIDTGVEPFPASASLYWYKGADETTTRPWMFVADSRAFYIGIVPDGSYGDFHGFGDFISYKPGDTYNCFLTGAYSASDDGVTYKDPLATKCANYDAFPLTQRTAFARNYAGIESSAVAFQTVGKWFGVNGTDLHALGGAGMTYPHLTDNGILYGNVFFQEYHSSYKLMRGYPPGLYDPWHPVQAALASVTTLITNAPEAGRMAALWRVRCATGYTYPNLVATDGNAMIDITGPWRE